MRPFRPIRGHKYFEAQENGEEVLQIVRMHWLILALPLVIGPIVILLLSIIALTMFDVNVGFLKNSSAELTKVAVMATILLFGALYIFSSWLSRYFNVLILTTRHIVDVSQAALFSRKVATLALESIEDVSIEKHGLFSNVFDYGDIVVQTAGELPNFRLDKIGDPEAVQKSIMEAKENHRR